MAVIDARAGRRVARTDAVTSASVHYLYDANGVLLAEHDGSTGAVLREYVWLNGMLVGILDGNPSSPTVQYVHTGHLNEPIMVTDASGNVTSSITRDPWGNAVLLAGSAQLNLGYPGQWHDQVAGLYQNWNRDYDPTLGRYVETDPIGLAGGANLYAYVDGNPINAVDATGQCPWCVPVIIGLGAGFLEGVGWDLLDQYLNTGPCKVFEIDWKRTIRAGARDAVIGAALGGVGNLAIKFYKARRAARAPTPHSPDFIGSSHGTIYPVPSGASGPVPVTNVAGKQTGIAFVGGKGGANGQVRDIRIMNPTPAKGKSPGYPDGYIKYQNGHSPKAQGVDPYTGHTLSDSKSHYPLK